MSGTVLAALAAAAVVTYDEVHNLHRMPCPARYLAVLAIFAAIGAVLGSRAPGLAAAFSWAIVLGLVIGANSTIVGTLTRRPHPKGATP